MKITITTDSGEVLDQVFMASLLAVTAKEFPNDTPETHLKVATEVMIETVSDSIRLLANK